MRLAEARIALLQVLLLGGQGLGCTSPDPARLSIDGWLDPRNPPAGPLAVGEDRLYALHLEPGQLLRLRAEQEGVDLTLALETPDGRELVFSDSPNGVHGPEWLVVEFLRSILEGFPCEGPAVNDTSEYRLRIAGIDGEGHFRVTVEHLGPPRPGDRALVRALELLVEGPYTENPDPGRPRALLEPPTGMPFEPPLPGLVRARLHYLHGWWLDDLGRLEEARRALEAAARDFERHGQAMERAPVLNTLGPLLSRRGRNAEAEQALRLALDLAEESDNLLAQAVGWNNLGVLLTARADPSAALRAYGRALDAHRRLHPDGPPTETVLVLHQNLGIEQVQLGRLDEGIAELEWVLEARRQEAGSVERDEGEADFEGRGKALLSLAWARGLEAPEMPPEPALDAFTEAIELLGKAGATEPLAVAFELRGQLLRRLGRTDAARTRTGPTAVVPPGSPAQLALPRRE